MRELYEKFKVLFGISPPEHEYYDSTREFERYDVEKLKGLYVTFNGGTKAEVINIGYGGMLLKRDPVAKAKLFDADGITECGLFVYGASYSFVVQLVRDTHRGIGVAFVHNDLEGFIWLRQFLAYIQIGMGTKPHGVMPRRTPDGEVLAHFRGPSTTNLSIAYLGDEMRRVDMAFKDGESQIKFEWTPESLECLNFGGVTQKIPLLCQCFFIFWGVSQGSVLEGSEFVVQDLEARLLSGEFSNTA